MTGPVPVCLHVTCPVCEGQGELLVSGDPRGDNAETRTCGACGGDPWLRWQDADAARQADADGWDGP